MDMKLKEMLDIKKNQLKRKERRIQEYIDVKNSIDGFKNNLKAELEYTKLLTEINMLKQFIEDLNYLI